MIRKKNACLASTQPCRVARYRLKLFSSCLVICTAWSTTSAIAIDDCGAPVAGGTVICNGDGTPVTDTAPYADGIFYSVAQELTLEVTSGAANIETFSNRAAGVTLLGNSASYNINIENGVNIITNRNISSGVLFEGSNASVRIDSAADITVNARGGLTSRGNGIEGRIVASGEMNIHASGHITTHGESSRGIFGHLSRNGTIAIQSDADIVTAGEYSHGILGWAFNTNAPNADVEIIADAGTITTSGNYAHGILALNRANSGSLKVVSGADITTLGDDVDGIRVQAGGTIYNFVTSVAKEIPYDVDIIGGRVVGGGGMGAALHVVSAIGGTIDIAEGATLDGSASGIAIRDGDRDGGPRFEIGDGIDEIGGVVTVTSAGTIIGNSLLGIENDTFNLVGGSVTGDIFADDATASAQDGDDRFTWSGGELKGGFYGQNGSDIATITGQIIYDGTTVLDGGDDVASGDGWHDVLVFRNVVGAAQTGTVINWEDITIDGGQMSFGDRLVVSTEDGYGLSVINGGTLDGAGAFELVGNLTLSNATFAGHGAGAGEYRFANNVMVTSGTLSLADGVVGDQLIIAGAYSASQATLALDVDFAADSADLLVLEGATDGATELVVNDVSQDSATGNDILVVDDANGIAHVNLSEPVVSGAYTYYLNQVGSDWYLQGELTPVERLALASVKGYGYHLGQIIDLPTYRQRTGGRVFTQDDDRLGFWSRFDGRRTRSELTIGNNALSSSQTVSRAEVGVDGRIFENQAGQLTGGIVAGYGSASSTLESLIDQGTIKSNFWSVGTTLSWEGTSGLYADAQAHHYWFDSDLTSVNSGYLAEDEEATGYGFSLEVGQAIKLGNSGFVIKPQAQLVYSRTDFDPFVAGQHFTVNQQDSDALNGRLGVAIEQSRSGKDARGQAYAMDGYGIANLHYSMLETQSVAINGQSAAIDRDDWLAEIGVGTRLSWADNRYTLHAEVRLASGFENVGDDMRASGNAGFKVRW